MDQLIVLFGFFAMSDQLLEAIAAAVTLTVLSLVAIMQPLLLRKFRGQLDDVHRKVSNVDDAVNHTHENGNVRLADRIRLIQDAVTENSTQIHGLHRKSDELLGWRDDLMGKLKTRWAEEDAYRENLEKRIRELEAA